MHKTGRATKGRSSIGGRAIAWTLQAALMVGSIALAINFGIHPAQPVGDEAFSKDVDEASGRGNASVPASSQARKAGHETEDMSARTMTKLVLGLGLVATLMVFGMIGLRSLFISLHQRGEPPLTTEQTTVINPPAPNLQTAPLTQLSAMAAVSNKLLDTYAWVDASHTQARIPIDRAMQLIIGHPLDTAP